MKKRNFLYQELRIIESNDRTLASFALGIVRRKHSKSIKPYRSNERNIFFPAPRTPHPAPCKAKYSVLTNMSVAIPVLC